MNLSDLLPKLVKNDEYQISIADKDNRNIITFNPTGYIGLSDELNAREVEEMQIVDGSKLIKIYLTATNNDPDPTP